MALSCTKTQTVQTEQHITTEFITPIANSQLSTDYFINTSSTLWLNSCVFPVPYSGKGSVLLPPCI